MAACSRLAAQTALIPAMLIALVVYCGSTGWTIWISMTNSRMLPTNVFVGLRQYQILFANERWLVSAQNLAIFGVLFIALALALGFFLASLIDQRIRVEDLLRSHLPLSVLDVLHRHRPGLAWLLNPTLRHREDCCTSWASKAFSSTGSSTRTRVIYTVWSPRPSGTPPVWSWRSCSPACAASTGDLEGGADRRHSGLARLHLRSSSRCCGRSSRPPSMLLATSVVQLYDLSVAMTNGGPGIASEVPAKFVMDHLFERAEHRRSRTAAATSC